MTRAHRLALAVAAAMFIAASAEARQAGSNPPPDPPSSESMGVSLKAIRNQLKQAPEPKPGTPTGNGMRYDFYVDVLGKRPPFEFFKDFDLSTKGGVRWGAPTHYEVLSVISPVWVNNARPYGGGVNLLTVGKKKR